MTPKKEEIRPEKIQSEKERIFELFNTIIMSLIKQVEVLRDYIQMTKADEQCTKILDQLGESNHSYSILFRSLLLKGIFLEVDKHDLQLVAESFEEIMYKIEHIVYRSHLVQLPEWFTTHQSTLLDYFMKMLKIITSWFENTQEAHLGKDIGDIRSIKRESLQKHRSFLEKMYQEELSIQEFTQMETTNTIIEDCLEGAEQLASRIYVILFQYQATTLPTPTFLS